MAKKPAKKRPLQPRIAPDVAAMVALNASRNSRSIPQEVNHTLRQHYSTVLVKTRGIHPTSYP